MIGHIGFFEVLDHVAIQVRIVELETGAVHGVWTRECTVQIPREGFREPQDLVAAVSEALLDLAYDRL